MQFPRSWLCSFVNPSITTDELSHRLTMTDLKMEEVDPVAPSFSQIVVGHVVEVNKHPGADCFSVCKVDAGTGELLQIVCGAPNVSVGIKVPCTLVGANLPPDEGDKPFKTKTGKLRGVESHGMLCSTRGLKLSKDHGGLLVLPEDTPVDEDIHKVLNLGGQIFIIKLTPNKANCLSTHGMARGMSVLTDTLITVPSVALVVVTLADKLPIEVEAPDLRDRFSGRITHSVNAHTRAPAWMMLRIGYVDMRNMSVLVDISNYVMLELGRLSYVFNLNKIYDGLTMCWGKAGEQLKLLNGDTITVDERVGVVSDEQAIESLADIMGGDRTTVTLDTQNIYVEVAFWWPGAIQGRARHYDLSIDAGYRFEHGVDYTTTVEHIECISALIFEICGSQAGLIDDQTVNLPKRELMHMRVARATRVLGISLPHDVVADVFKRLDLTLSVDGDMFIVEPPSYRFGPEVEEDPIEGIARTYSPEWIPARPLVAGNVMRLINETHRTMHDVRHIVAVHDYHGVVSFALAEAEWEADFAGNTNSAPLLSPIASQYSVIRSTLANGLLDKVRYNLNRKASRVRMLEAGHAPHRDATVTDDGLPVTGYA